jgi:hypothetical protein
MYFGRSIGWPFRVTLSEAKTSVPACHPERSEGSRSEGAEMLRCAQHDKNGPYQPLLLTLAPLAGAGLSFDRCLLPPMYLPLVVNPYPAKT